jgi:hypothetical protein
VTGRDTSKWRILQRRLRRRLSAGGFGGRFWIYIHRWIYIQNLRFYSPVNKIGGFSICIHGRIIDCARDSVQSFGYACACAIARKMRNCSCECGKPHRAGHGKSRIATLRRAARQVVVRTRAVRPTDILSCSGERAYVRRANAHASDGKCDDCSE